MFGDREAEKGEVRRVAVSDQSMGRRLQITSSQSMYVTRVHAEISPDAFSLF